MVGIVPHMQVGLRSYGPIWLLRAGGIPPWSSSIRYDDVRSGLGTECRNSMLRSGFRKRRFLLLSQFW